MERFSRKERELKETIEQQKEQLARYEKKLRDVIQAYKGIQKEKEALEASLKALNEIKSNPDVKTCETENAPIKSSNSDNSELLSVSENDITVNGEHVEQLKLKVNTLSDALSTITAEKSRIEANFQRDRKRLLHEKEDLEKSLASACTQADATAADLKQQLNDIKSQLKNEKAERLKETANSQIIIRELQKTISEERQKKEALEIELNVKSGRLAQAVASANQLEAAERKIRDLSNELESAKMKLKGAEQKIDQPSPMLLQLQNELADLKISHRVALDKEQQKAAEAEEVTRQLAAAHESRVATLEARLTELSESVGSYDRLRQQDLMAMAKLKEQLSVLQNSPKNFEGLEPDDDDINKLIDKMMVLKRRIYDVNSRSSQPLNFNMLFQDEGMNSKADHEGCKEEITRLKQEIEIYKQRNDQHSSASEKSLRDELLKCRLSADRLKRDLESKEEEYRESFHALQDSWLKERETWKKEHVVAERGMRARICDLEQQLLKQRERSLSLLQEKDEELNSLRDLLQMKRTSQVLPVPSPKEVNSHEEEDVWPEALAPLASMTVGAMASGGQILHYVEELARKEKEIQGLRKAKHKVELALRELQMASVAREEKAAEENNTLREDIARLERNQSREGANLEYLKNVLLNFLVHSDAVSQSHMFNAIATILHFSPREIQRIRQQHPKWKIQINIPSSSGSV